MRADNGCSPSHAEYSPTTAATSRLLAGPGEQTELLALWQDARRSLLKSRQQLLNEAEFLLADLPLELRDELPDGRAVRPRLAALVRRNRRRRFDAPTTLRLRLLDEQRAQIVRKKEARRILKRHLSDVIYRRMTRDLHDHAARRLLAA